MLTKISFGKQFEKIVLLLKVQQIMKKPKSLFKYSLHRGASLFFKKFWIRGFAVSPWKRKPFTPFFSE